MNSAEPGKARGLSNEYDLKKLAGDFLAADFLGGAVSEAKISWLVSSVVTGEPNNPNPPIVPPSPF